ncbi:MAG: NAD-dependent epimerase/dehydratase family protein, partial [Cyclobacteriaceae bacterium]|nr:NAD-dependent epimerase/dehydratase family protein [Cyclobacteriaceae bacterium]
NPARKKYKGLEDYKDNIPDVKDEIDLIKTYGAPTVAVTVNTMKMKETDARAYASAKEKELGIPVVLPLEDGVGRLLEGFKRMINNQS